MSQTGQTTNLSESYPVTNLTLLVLFLIPCVVLLLLLNCVFLGYKFLIMSKKNTKKREDEEMLLQSTLSTRHRVMRTGDVPSCFANQDGLDGVVRTYVSVPTPQQPVTSSRTSTTTDQRLGLRFLRPDGATGTGSGSSRSLRAPSTILATSSDRTSSVARLPKSHNRMSHKYCPTREMDWLHNVPVMQQYSDSDTDVIQIIDVPPNSPEEVTSMLDLLTDVQQQPCLNSSSVNLGLDSDFGASAGVSLRILSTDSDGLLPSGVLASVLEWDYYDPHPCYVRQNRIPKQDYHIPSIHPKQYWV